MAEIPNAELLRCTLTGRLETDEQRLRTILNLPENEDIIVRPFEAGGFALEEARTIHAPLIAEAFLSLECTLTEAKDLTGAGQTAMVTGQVRHAWVEEAYARGYDRRYGKDGFMLLVPAPQDLLTGAPGQSGIATVDIERLD